MSDTESLRAVEERALAILDGPSEIMSQELANLIHEHPEHRAWIDRMARNRLASIDESPGPLELPIGRSTSGSEMDSGQLVHSAIERFEERELLAAGGMGLIRRLHDVDLRRTVVKKTLRIQARQTASTSKTLPAPGRHVLYRFLEEAQVTGQLEHPNIVPVHDIGIDAQGDLYFTMPEIRGRTLSDIFANASAEHDTWTDTRVLDVLLKVCDALTYAHTKGVVHRDIKPSNIMVGRFGEVYLMDWGLALVEGRSSLVDQSASLESEDETTLDSLRSEKILEEPWSSIPTGSRIVGTPYYMAPEQARNAQDVNAHADVYAMGAILYHWLAGKPPYAEFGDPVAILRALLEGPAQPVRDLAPEASPELVAITEKAMARDPKMRYATVHELATDLRNVQENRVVKAHQTGTLPEIRKWVVRNRALTYSLSALFAAVVIGLFVALILLDQTLAKEKELSTSNASLTEQQGQTQLQLARLATQRGLWPEALEAYEEALRKGPEDTFEIQHGRTTALFALGRPHEATEILENISGNLTDRQQAKLHLMRGERLYDRTEDATAGLEEVEKALKLGLSEADTEFAKALLAKSFPEARLHLEGALDREPANRSVNELYGHFLAFSGDFDRLEQFVEILSSVFREDPLPHLLRTTLVAGRGDASGAHTLLDSLVQYADDPRLDSYHDAIDLLTLQKDIEDLVLAMQPRRRQGGFSRTKDPGARKRDDREDREAFTIGALLPPSTCYQSGHRSPLQDAGF